MRRSDSDLPAGLPSPTELRTLAQHLDDQMPAAEALGLVKRKEYPLIHELAGFHEAIDAIRALADELDALEAEAREGQ